MKETTEKDNLQKTAEVIVNYFTNKQSNLIDFNPSIKMVSATLDAMLELGFQIKLPANTAASTFEEAEVVLQLLEGSNKPNLNLLLSKWNTRSPENWPDSPNVYQLLGERFLKLGSPLAAYDVFIDGLSRCPGNIRLRQLLALALARSGGTVRAQKILSDLHDEGDSSEETLGLLARTHKDLWLQISNPIEPKNHLHHAFKYYSQAYEKSGGYWTGINAATMAFLLNNRDTAFELARKVHKAGLEDFQKLSLNNKDTYWALATLREVNLILGNRQDSLKYYSQAAENGKGRFGDLSSTRRNARLLLKHLEDPGEDIERCFEIPPVIVFAGWIKDGESVVPPNLSPEHEHVLFDEIQKRLKNLNFSLAFASANSSLDLLFLETIKNLKGELNVILSNRDNNEIAKSRQRLDNVLADATQVLIVSDQRILEDSTANEYAELFLIGIANLRAQQLETDLIPIVVSEGDFTKTPEKASQMLDRFKKLGLKAEFIHIPEMGKIEPLKSALSAPSSNANNKKNEGNSISLSQIKKTLNNKHSMVIRALLFGDAHHFSKLVEEQIPIFNEEFMGPIGEMVYNSPYAPLIKNTWGDGLYFVFKTVSDAGLFALDLCEFVNSVDWQKKGLPSTMNLRIALHAGPVFPRVDPITMEQTFVGTHVSRAARLEPITPIGQVYSSQAFAALSAAEHIEEFNCEYVGQTPLAKGYGTFPTYHVRRANKR